MDPVTALQGPQSVVFDPSHLNSGQILNKFSCIVLIQQIKTIFIDHLLIFKVFRAVRTTLASVYATVYHADSQVWRMKMLILNDHY
jgi:hypothetical protein